ncbi:MAG TPA: YfhO family protein [Bryobacteraceae bacterium]|nr:YfhO family protein [Bryobacteraceae bacterium]
MSAAKAITELGRAGERPRKYSLSRRFAGPLILLLLVIGFFWKLVLTKQYAWLASYDLALQVAPWLDFEAQQFHLHRIPLWDPFLFGGQSLIGQGQPGLAYPINWILFSLPLRHGHINFDILNWYFAAIHFMGALFCFLLCRDLKCGISASVLAGLSFGLGGYVGNTDWPQMINGAIWGPLVLMFLLRAGRDVHIVASGAFAGFFLGVSWLSGHHQIPIFLTLASAGVWLYFLFEDGHWRPSRVKPAAAFSVLFVLTGALQMWPVFEYGHLSVRWVGSSHDPLAWNQAVPYSVHQQFSLSPIHLLGLIIAGYTEHTALFTGVVAIALAGFALACCWKTKEVRILCGLGVAGLFLAIAKNDTLHGMLYSIVPLFEKARSPDTAIYLFHLAVAVLLAFGVDALLSPENRARARRTWQALLVFGGLVFLIIMGVDIGRAMNWGMDDRIVICPLVALALAGLVYRFSRPEASRAWLPVVLGALLLMELGNQALYWTPAKEDKVAVALLTPFDTTREVADFLKRQPGPLRADVSREDIEFNFGDWYGIDTMEALLPSVPANLYNVEFTSGRTRLLYGTNFAVGKKPTMADEQEVFRDSSGLIVYRVPQAFPRAWTVHEAVVAKNPQDAQRLSQDPNFDLRKKTFTYAPVPALESCDGDSIESFTRGINSTTAVVDMKCGGMLVESENYAPGWTAKIDGKRAPVYEAYTALRGVVVGPGRHKIEMRYRPMSVSAGAIATFSGMLIALCLWIAPRVRGRQNGV